MPLLEVENLKTWYPVKGSWFEKRQHIKAVNGVSFSIDEKETVGLVGESGCGKSTLGRSVVRLEKPLSGRIIIDGEDISQRSGASLRKLRTGFQMIFQDPYGSLNPRMTIHSMLDEILYLHTRHNRQQRKDEIVKLLEMVGLSAEHMYRYPHQFSGGQRQRIGIARALSVNPKLIIADEPVSALDVSVQAQIINLLEKIQRETGIAYLFIAHDLAVVGHISDRILVMYLGRIVESGTSTEVISDPTHPYTKALISAVPNIDPKTKRKRIILPGDVPSPQSPPPGCPFHPRCPIAKDRCRQDTPELKPVDKDDPSQCSACFFAKKKENEDN